MIHLLDMTIEQLTGYLGELGEKPFHAKQITAWVFGKKAQAATDFSQMSDQSAALRQKLAEDMVILSGKVVSRSDSQDDVTKLLIQWPDGQCVESVLIPAKQRVTACVSTQVGCAIGCTFCASGSGGLQRNLTGGEIVEQVLQLQQACRQKVTHVVFMGMGEPLANYDATLAAVRALIDPLRGGISARRITISTIGLPKGIRRLAAEDIPLTLAISLHAPSDALRHQLMPKAPASIAEILEAAEVFFQSRKRELTLEYILLEGVNDTNVCAQALAIIAHQLRCNVNLIRYNPVPGSTYGPTSQGATKMFATRLERQGVNVQIRLSRGQSADAACGQLRNRLFESKNTHSTQE